MTKEYRCIICDLGSKFETIEHIVPESLGNKHYILEQGIICDHCNNHFSSFESKVLYNTVLGVERARLGVPTKKGSTAKAKLHSLSIEGDKNFRKHLFSVKGIKPNDFKYNPKDDTYSLFVPTFDRSEVATSKFLIKIGLESLYKSNRQIFNMYDLKAGKLFIRNKEMYDWPFITTKIEIGKFYDIPKYYDKYKLKKNKILLRIQQLNKDTLLFKFKYGGIALMINLISRNHKWVKEYIENDDKARVYPVHYEKKIVK